MQVKLLFPKKTKFPLTCLLHVFSLFLVPFWRSLGFFWRPFGASVVSLACGCHPCRCLWLAWVVFGLTLLLFVVLLARLGCLWARGPFQDRFLLYFWSILGSFLEEFGGGIERFFDFICERCCVRFLSLVRLFGTFRDGIRWIWSRTGKRREDGLRETRKRRGEKREEESRAENRKEDKRREEKRREEKRREEKSLG